MNIKEFVRLAIEEDIKEGDHSALACIPEDANGKAKLLVKEEGIIAGIKIAKQIFKEFESQQDSTNIKIDKIKRYKNIQPYCLNLDKTNLLLPEHFYLKLIISFFLLIDSFSIIIDDDKKSSPTNR